MPWQMISFVLLLISRKYIIWKGGLKKVDIYIDFLYRFG